MFVEQNKLRAGWTLFDAKNIIDDHKKHLAIQDDLLGDEGLLVSGIKPAAAAQPAIGKESRKLPLLLAGAGGLGIRRDGNKGRCLARDALPVNVYLGQALGCAAVHRLSEADGAVETAADILLHVHAIPRR